MHLVPLWASAMKNHCICNRNAHMGHQQAGLAGLLVPLWAPAMKKSLNLQ